MGTTTKTLLTSTAATLFLAAPALAETITVTEASAAAISDALAAAAASDSASTVVLAFEGDVEITGTMAYDGQSALALIGNGQTISTADNVTLLAATQGADMHVAGLTLAGPGGWTVENRGDMDGSAGKGIFVDLRDDQTGTATLVAEDVTVSGIAGYGIHISDCTLADDCGGGQTGDGDGSDAGISVTLRDVTINDVGNGTFDGDGLRADERGAGGISAMITGSTVSMAGADGIELDEGGAGDVVATIIDSQLVENGAYCTPALFENAIPDPDEAEFEQGATAEADIPGPVTGTADDSCVEREVDLYDDGSVEAYEFGLDLDDGIDFDEGGAGSIHAVFLRSTISRNLDEGVDFDEAGDGGIDVQFIDTVAEGNTDDGYKNSEEDAGSVTGLMLRSTATDNGGKGAVFEEEGDGDLAVTAEASSTANNDDSDDTGIEAVQEDGGMGALTLIDSDIADGTDLDGVTVE
ncbi:MAG: hypothetical protein GVY31_02665 [Alphaproteobacteria bacterium]|jgi:hypothetical protein|nr:hypothetical protein [Alphaproteobacteria bacterium]